jgi:uncharacterized membrane protein
MDDFMRHTPDMNVNQPERIVSLVAGGIVLYSVARRSMFRIVLGLGAGYLLYRGITGKDPLLEKMGLRPADQQSRSIRVERAITVNKPPQQVYVFWRNFENLPQFMDHLKEVQILDNRRSHCVAKGPLERSVEWDAEITDERENEFISWRSLPGSQVPNSGTVTFRPAPDGRGTEVHVLMAYMPPAGTAGAIVAKLTGEEPNTQVREDLHRFKQVMETGEVQTREGQLHGAM